MVALGACGGLADAALALASRHAASALVLPCCFAKHDDLSPADAHWRVPDADKQLLCGMADAGDESEVAAPARRVIGRLRLAKPHETHACRRLALKRRVESCRGGQSHPQSHFLGGKELRRQLHAAAHSAACCVQLFTPHFGPTDDAL